jgi:chromosome segregation ATPase
MAAGWSPAGWNFDQTLKYQGVAVMWPLFFIPSKDTMLTANRLEKIMELENNLREQYQEQLNDKQAEIDRLLAREKDLQAEKDTLQGTIDTQLANLKELSGKATANDRVEQHNRELSNRSEKQQAEISELKKRVRALQKDLAEVREENKTLTQYDPLRMRKNLDANKKKLAEKTRANDTLQKALKQSKRDQAELQQRVAELEARLAELEPAEAEDAGEEKAAA